MATSTPSPTPPPGAANSNGQTMRGPFAVMTILFFMWGFITVWNDVLIPRFKEAFTLSYFQAMLVQFAFFGAYGFGALIYFLIHYSNGRYSTQFKAFFDRIRKSGEWHEPVKFFMECFSIKDLDAFEDEWKDYILNLKLDDAADIKGR